MSPVQIRRENAKEIFLLIRRLNRFSARENKIAANGGKRIIRRPAGDDWF